MSLEQLTTLQNLANHLDYGQGKIPHFDNSEMMETIKKLYQDGFFYEKQTYGLVDKFVDQLDENEDEDEDEDRFSTLYQFLFDTSTIGKNDDYEKNKDRYMLVDRIILEHFKDADLEIIEEAIEDCMWV